MRLGAIAFLVLFFAISCGGISVIVFTDRIHHYVNVRHDWHFSTADGLMLGMVVIAVGIIGMLTTIQWDIEN